MTETQKFVATVVMLVLVGAGIPRFEDDWNEPDTFTRRAFDNSSPVTVTGSFRKA